MHKGWNIQSLEESAIAMRGLQMMPPVPSPSRSDPADSPSPESIELLGELFSSRIRAKLLTFLIPRLDKRFSLTELSRELDAPISSLQHECYKMERLGFLIGRREGGSRRYRVAVDEPITDALVHLVVTAMGIEQVLHAAFSATNELEGALIAGSPDPSASGTLHLVLIGDLALERVQSTLDLVARLTGHTPDQIELAFFQPVDWKSHRDRGHPVVQRLLDLPILVAFGELGGFIGN